MRPLIRITQKPGILCLCASLCLCSVSCRRLEYGSALYEELERTNAQLKEELEQLNEARQLQTEVMRRFSLIRRQISDRKLNEAERNLAELGHLEQFEEEIKSLQALIDTARKLSPDTTELALDREVVLNESTDKLKLPDNYGHVIHMSSPQPYDAPPTKLESLLEKKVSLQINNMPLDDFAMTLGNLDGLNVADPMNVIFSNETIKSKTFSANFKDVPLRELFAFISRNLGVDFNIVDNLIWVTAAAEGAAGVPLETQVIPLGHGIIPKVPEGIAVTDKAIGAGTEEDDDLETALKTFYATSKTGGTYTLFRTRNMLLVNDTRANIRRIEELVKCLDKIPYQVLIEARFLTVSQSDLRDIGVELKHYNGGTTGANIGATNDTNANLSHFATELGAITTGHAEGFSGLTVSGILGNRSFDILLSAIESKESTVNISAPRVTTMNNRTARLRKGDKRYSFEQYNLQTVDNGDKGKDQILVPNGKPTSLPLGITFDVKVNIGNDGKTIFLGLHPEIITFLKWEDYISTETTTANNVTTTRNTNVMLPRTHEQSIAASLAIRSGETVILGGMVENATRRITRKVPLLGDIPYLGAMFRHVRETTEPTNLLIFVTATVIDENGNYIVIDD